MYGLYSSPSLPTFGVLLWERKKHTFTLFKHCSVGLCCYRQSTLVKAGRVWKKS